jgi:iron(III) transport system permease protein
MLSLVILLIWLERRGRADRRYTASTRRPRAAQPVPLAGRAGWLAAGACFLPVLAGFVLPAGFLLGEVVERGLLDTLDAPSCAASPTRSASPPRRRWRRSSLGMVVVTCARLARHRLTEIGQT